MVVDLRTRFAEVTAEMFLDDARGDKVIDRKYFRRIAVLFNRESVTRLKIGTDWRKDVARQSRSANSATGVAARA